MTRKRDMKYLSAILILMISLAACGAPKIVVPEITRKSYSELRETQPDCTMEIEAIEAADEIPAELALDALYCYRRVWKHWENEYRILDAELEAVEKGGGEE